MAENRWNIGEGGDMYTREDMERFVNGLGEK